MTTEEMLGKYKTAIEMLESLIPTSEKIPENGEMVLVLTRVRNGHIRQSRAYHDDKGWHGSRGKVIAWLPIKNKEE